MEIFYVCAVQYGSRCHLWLFSTCNVVHITEFQVEILVVRAYWIRQPDSKICILYHLFSDYED